MRLDDLEFFLDIRIEKSIEVKSVWTFFPTSKIGYFVSMDHVAFGAKLIDVAYFRIYGSKKQARVRHWAVTHIAWTIIPSKTYSSVKINFSLFAFGGIF